MPDPEWWLLETAVLHREFLGRLIGPGYEGGLNKSGHGLRRAELAGVLERLLWLGDITIRDNDRRERLYTAGELEALLRPRLRTHTYGLTAQGGRRWEGLARPDWNRFVDESWGDPVDSGPDGAAIWTGELSGVDERHLKRYLELRLPAFGQHLVPGSATEERLESWEATYWKALPFGLRIHCKAIHSWRMGPWNPAITEEFDRWYHRCEDAG